MRAALVNPPWSFEGSICFGCREPQLPLYARRSVPFVQANLIKTAGDAAMVTAWREKPLYSYPSSPDYHRLRGTPDDGAWERAHAHCLAQSGCFSGIQEERPLALAELEAACPR